ncbi:MAG TPA: hypothetical protein VNJ52_05170 [Patescibacteria group bacterium]|nr:hypothetical protein [Patescibacteria group bacterium]
MPIVGKVGPPGPPQTSNGFFKALVFMGIGGMIGVLGLSLVFQYGRPAPVNPPQNYSPPQSAEPAPVEAKPLPIDAGPLAVAADADVLHVAFWDCRRYAAAVKCVGNITNTYDQSVTEGLLLSGVKDESGNEYVPQSVKIGGSACEFTYGCRVELSGKQSEELALMVDGILPSAQAVVLNFHLQPHQQIFASPYPNNVQPIDFSITVPIEMVP